MATLLYPPSVDWEMTSECNHRCIHCYNYWRTISTATEKKKKDKSFYIDCAKKLVKARPVSIQVTGGEPLLVFDRIKEALQLLIDSGICVSINTNATMVTDKIADFLAKNEMDAFVSFPCSREDVFDSIVNAKGAANRAKEGIIKLIQHGVRVSPNMVVTKINLPYVYETAKYIHDTFHVPYFSATKASFPQNADKNFRNQILNLDEFNSMLRQLLRVRQDFGMRIDSAWVYSLCGFSDTQLMETFGFRRKCACGRYNFVLDSEGNIKACGCDNNSFGSIFSDSFAEAITKMKEWQDASLLAPECKTCSSLKFCGGGCRADSLSMNGCSCALDSTANPHNCSRCIPEVNANYYYEDDCVLKIHPDASIVAENGFSRISRKTNYEFISIPFASILASGSISVRDLRSSCNLESTKLYRDLNKLISKGLLQECVSPATTVELPKTPFTLLVSPYVSDNSSKLIVDYSSSENNSKRFS